MTDTDFTHDELLRTSALDYAVRLHRDDIDTAAVVETAEAFLKFLKGAK